MEGLTLFRSVLTVLIVLVIAYWCSRVLARQWMKSSGSANLQIIEQLQVGQNQRILLLKTGESHYLIGVSQAGIQCLAEVKQSLCRRHRRDRPSFLFRRLWKNI